MSPDRKRKSVNEAGSSKRKTGKNKYRESSENIKGKVRLSEKIVL
jgi:hypothetical protein